MERQSVSATAEVNVVEQDKNKVLCITNAAEKAGGPRLSKALYLKGVDDLTSTFRTKSEGSASIGFWMCTDKTAILSRKGASADWTDKPFYKWHENNLLETHHATFGVSIDFVEVLIWYDAAMHTENITPISPDGIFNSNTKYLHESYYKIVRFVHCLPIFIMLR